MAEDLTREAFDQALLALEGDETSDVKQVRATIALTFATLAAGSAGSGARSGGSNAHEQAFRRWKRDLEYLNPGPGLPDPPDVIQPSPLPQTREERIAAARVNRGSIRST